MGKKKAIFSATIEIIGINPFVFIPEDILKSIFVQADKDKGKIPVKLRIEGHEFPQTLIRYSGHWRLYLNTPMRKAAKKDVGDSAEFELWFDPGIRVLPMHPALKTALDANKQAKKVFDKLPPSLRQEIIRYLSFLKNTDSVERNVNKAIDFLLGKQRFIGRDKP
jgi:uncharacterized protein DUF1905/bacteriocin resistance YdeI/OmpD-like protein